MRTMTIVTVVIATTTMTDTARTARSSAWVVSIVVVLACMGAVAHTELHRAAAVDPPEMFVELREVSPPVAGVVRAAPVRRRVVVVRRSRAS